MANGGRIDFTIGYKVDEAGIAKIRHQLEELSSMSATQIQKANPNLNMGQARAALLQIRDAAGEVQTAMQSAFNPTTGVMNLERLRNSLQQLNLQQIQQAFNQAGQTGQSAFLGISKAALTTSVQLRQTEGILDHIGQTLANTIRWSISSSAINAFTGAIQQAYGYVQHLDTSLNDIRIVTGKSADEMDKFAEKANDAAKALGASTTDYTEAALIYYQQGLSDEESQARAETTLKAANVTGQTGREVSEQLTSVWNGYKVTAEETEMYVDKLAAVAATTASDLEELSTGMSKVASAANNMGVDVDQLNAQLATIISVTRQAPETAGTALKTIYARLEDLKISGEDEEGVKLGEVSSTLDELGIHVIDAEGNLRDLGEVIEEVASKWDTWTKAQQSAAAQAMAGKRQYNNLLALFDNWDMYTSALETSRNSLGTLQEQQDIYMESTAAHLQKLETQWEDLYDSLLNSDDINSVADALTKLVDIITDIVDATGGLKGMLSGLVGLIGTTFSRQIANAFGPFISNINAARQNAEILDQLLANITFQRQTGAISGQAAQEMTEAQEAMSRYWSVMSEEEINASQQTIREIGDWADKREAIENATQSMRTYFETYGDQRSRNIVANNTQITDFQSTNTDVEYLTKRLEKGQRAIEGMVDYSKQLEKAMNQTNVQTVKFGTNSRQVRTQLANVNGSIVEIERRMQRANRLGLIDPQQLASAQNLIAKIRQEMSDIQNPNTRKTSFTQELIDDLVKLGNLTGTSKAQIQGYLDTLRNGASSFEDCQTAIRGLRNALGETEKQTRAFIQGITQLLGAFSSLYYGINSVSNIGEIFADDKLDGVEKFKQTLMALLMGLPMIVRGLQALSSALQFFTNTTSLAAAMTSLLQGGISGLVTGFRTLSATILSIPGIGWILAITAALTALIAIVKAHQKALENDAEAAKENAKAQQEKIDKTKQEKDKIDELAKSYENLLNQKEKDKDFTEEQKNEIYELVKAYGDQDLIIQALAGDYDKLAKSIKTAQIEQNKQYQNELEQGQRVSTSSLTSSIKANGGMTQIDSEGFDFSGYNDKAWQQLFVSPDYGKITKQTELETKLASLIGESGKDIISSSGHIDYDNLIKILTSDSEELYNILDQYQGVEVADEIRDLLSSNAEVIKELKQYEEELNKTKLDILGNEYLEEAQEDIKDLMGFEVSVQELAQEALEKGLFDSLEDARQWAKEFIGSVSDEFGNFEQQSYIGDAILDGILPSDEKVEERKQEILNRLGVLSEGGNVDLTNRPIINKANGRGYAETYGIGDGYATVNTSTYGDETTGYINFTPIIVDPETGEYKGYLSPSGLDDYVNNILQNSSTDTKNLQIGSVFSNLTDAINAAIEYHNLHEELYDISNEELRIQKITEDVYARVEKLGPAAQQYIADNIELVTGLINKGWDVKKVFDNLQADIDAFTAQDYEVKIKAVFDEGFNGKKFEEKVHDLFADESFNIGISEEQFLQLTSGQQASILDQASLENAMALDELSDKQSQAYKERHDEIQSLVDEERKNLETLTNDYNTVTERYKGFIDAQRGEASKLAEDLLGLEGEQKEATAAIYMDTAQRMVDAYKKAEEEGKNGADAARKIYGEATEDIQKMIDAGIKKFGSVDAFLGQWKNMSKAVDETKKSMEESQSALEGYENDLDNVENAQVNWIERLRETHDAVDEINKDIDNLQKTYQFLTNAVEEYNTQGYMSLDTVQELINMDSSYLASLEMVDGQLQLNGDTYSTLMQLQAKQLKLKAAEIFLEELRAIAANDSVTALQKAEAANNANADSMQKVIDKAKEGVPALYDYAKAVVAAAGGDVTKNEKAIKDSTDAFNMKLQMIDDMMSQPIDSILGKKDKSSSKSSSEKEAKHEDHLEREADLYRNINSELKQIESTLGRIQKENNYKWGKDLQEGLKRENKLLDQQLAKLKEKSKMQEKDLGQRRAQLEAQGYQFSEDGSTITNAEAKLDTLYAQYNQMIDNYNSMSADQQEEYKKQLDEEKKNIDKIEKGLKDYESLFSDYQGTLDSILDLHYQQIENAVSRFNNMVDVHLELDDARKEWTDFWYEVVEDAENLNVGINLDYFDKKIDQSMKKLETLIGLGKKASDSEISTLTKHLNETVTQVKAQIASKDRGGEDSLFGDATKLSKENLEKYRDELMSAVREAKTEVDNIAQNYLDLFDTAQKKIDKQVEGWEAINDHIEHNISLIKLVSGEKAFGPILKQYEKLHENNLKLVETQKISRDNWAKEIDKYKKLLETTEEGSALWKTYSESLEKATENFKKAVTDLDKSVQEALEDLKTWRETQKEAILDELDKAVSKGAGGLEVVQKEWELIKEDSARYLDNVERAVEIELYTNDLEKAANATSISAKNQERLNKFREEELKKLKEKKTLTQYDIDESRARLNILQQEIALEEARNNKSNMRLRRDSQGNYSYQYTGDEAAQDEAENNLLTAKKEWYELVKNRFNELIEYQLKKIQERNELIAKRDQALLEGNYEAAQTYQKMIEDIRDQIDQNAIELNKNEKDLISGTAQFFSDIKDASILPTSKAIAVGVSKDTKTIAEAGETAIKKLDKSLDEYGKKTQEILDMAGVKYDDLTQKGIDPTQEALEELNETNEDLEDELDEINSLLDKEADCLAQAEEGYNKLKDAAVDAIEAANEALKELSQTAIETQEKVQAAIQTTQQAQQQSNATSPSDFHSTRDDSDGGTSSNPSLTKAKLYRQYYDSGTKSEDTEGNYYITVNGKQEGQFIRAENRTTAIEEFKKRGYDAYATGGYTGSWNDSDGRLAMLHQKELVLNESDTSNLLKAINVLRQVVTSMNFSGIADSLVSSTAQWMNKAATQPLTASNISNISSVNNDTNNNYKNITVNADFSGVQSADAIYQALTELENYGMQESYSVAPYANKSY